MRHWSRTILHLRLIRELIRYDVMDAVLGFKGVHSEFRPRRVPFSVSADANLEATVCEAMRRVVPWYWKRVQCLQRSVATARVLRAYGHPAEVVVGYRLAPFLGHAWVEVGGRVVNDSPTFQSRLRTLERF